MWILQNDSLMEIPDDLPMPPYSRAVEPPPELLLHPRDFRIENGEFVHAPQPKRERAPRLTVEEIEQVRDALGRGLFKAVAETPERRAKRKEEK
jgi:hypothetical protein